MAIVRSALVSLFVGGIDAVNQCEFDVVPKAPYTWDESCAILGGVPGCNADGKHLQCRFCDAEKYLPCDQGVTASTGTSLCKFEVAPTTPFTWDPSCAGGVPGCSADGEHLQCRFCGGHPFLPCPASKKEDNWCRFDVEPGSHCPTTTETSTTTTTVSTTSTQTTTTMTRTSSTSTS